MQWYNKNNHLLIHINNNKLLDHLLLHQQHPVITIDIQVLLKVLFNIFLFKNFFLILGANMHSSMSRTQRSRLRADETTGKYKLLKTIGKGNFAKVLLKINVLI